MTSVLDSIIQGVHEDLAARKAQVSLAELKRIVTEVPAALPAAKLLADREFSVIAEVKRASPSKGFLSEIPEPAELAAQYQLGGAQVISVLTEQRRFNGTLTDLDEVRHNVSIPVLRKDFMVDEYQFWEARAHGADVILLIVAALDDNDLANFNSLSQEFGMSVLVEVHNEAELARALKLKPELVGVNARNLKTLDVDLAVCEHLIPLIPQNVFAVAESGISTTSEVERLVAAGARAVLVGEALVTGGTPAETVREWTKAGAIARANYLHGKS